MFWLSETRFSADASVRRGQNSDKVMRGNRLMRVLKINIVLELVSRRGLMDLSLHTWPEQPSLVVELAAGGTGGVLDRRRLPGSETSETDKHIS